LIVTLLGGDRAPTGPAGLHHSARLGDDIAARRPSGGRAAGWGSAGHALARFGIGWSRRPGEGGFPPRTGQLDPGHEPAPGAHGFLDEHLAGLYRHRAECGQRRQHRVQYRPKLRSAGLLADDEFVRLGQGVNVTAESGAMHLAGLAAKLIQIRSASKLGHAASHRSRPRVPARLKTILLSGVRYLVASGLSPSRGPGGALPAPLANLRRQQGGGLTGRLAGGHARFAPVRLAARKL
jgi:hypothetical protein